MGKEKQIIQRWKELPFLYKIQLWSYFIAGVSGAVSYPLTTKMIYSSVDVSVLSSRLVLSSCIGLLLSYLWLTIQERMYKWFIQFTVLECISYILLVAYVIWSADYNNYLIFSTVIGATIGHIVSGGASKLHQKITDNEQYRTDYNFFIQIISSIGVILGSTVAMLVDFNIGMAFFLLLVSVILFQVTDIYVYKKCN